MELTGLDAVADPDQVQPLRCGEGLARDEVRLPDVGARFVWEEVFDARLAFVARRWTAPGIRRFARNRIAAIGDPAGGARRVDARGRQLPCLMHTHLISRFRSRASMVRQGASTLVVGNAHGVARAPGAARAAAPALASQAWRAWSHELPIIAASAQNAAPWSPETRAHYKFDERSQPGGAECHRDNWQAMVRRLGPPGSSTIRA